jgi:hypothetical protein
LGYGKYSWRVQLTIYTHMTKFDELPADEQEELLALQAARVQMIIERADDCCEVCQSDWFRNVDYTRGNFVRVSDAGRELLRKIIDDEPLSDDELRRWRENDLS